MIERRRRVLLAIIGSMVVALIAGTSILVWRSLVGAANQETLRHQQVAERVFDELEDELTSLIDKEESRSFLEYRFFYVPSDQLDGQAALSRSSLSVPPVDDAIVGYFHIDPNGERFTPMYPRMNEIALATDNGWSATEEVLEVRDTLDEVLSACESALWTEEAPPPPPPPPPPKPTRKQLAKPSPQPPSNAYTTQSFNLGTNRRGERETQTLQTKSSNISNFEANDADIQDVVVRNAQLDTIGDRQTDVVISPIGGLLVEDEYLVLQRQVRIGRNTHRQGLALDIDVLSAQLEAVVLGENELEPYITLDFNGVAQPAPFTFTHTLAEPFQDLVVTASIEVLPGQERLETGAIWLLAVMLGFVTILGSGALYRMVSTELMYAQKRTDFVAAVSHELKTPLTSIRLYAEMLQEGMVASEAKREEYYRTITAESDRLGRLIDNVLELGRLERNAQAATMVAGDVLPIVEDVASMLRPHAENKGFTLEINAEPDLPPVQIDRDALTQILVNLVDNGIKFAAESSDKRLVIRAIGFGSGVQLVVRDFGPGVPSTQLSDVFEPFFRGERELTRKTRGTGIGLALVRGLANRMGAQLSARNHPEGGFEVTLMLSSIGSL